MVHCVTSAKSKFLSLYENPTHILRFVVLGISVNAEWKEFTK